ncbi:MAG: hypothetical protein ACR2PK_02060 [Acidimicrobiales bacterium]
MDKTTDRAGSPTKAFLRTFLPAVVLAGGVAIFVIAFVVADTPSDDDVIFSHPAIEALLPAEGSEVLRQSQVGIDLIAGYEAELTINGTPIPPDQVNVFRNPDDPGESAEQAGAFATTINRFVYQPLEGRAVPELKGDENCATATFWPTSDPTDIRTVEWCFTVA